MNNRIMLCALLLSPSSPLLSAGNFAPDKVVEDDQSLSTSGYMAAGFWLTATALIGGRIAGTDNLLKKEILEYQTRNRLEKIKKAEPINVADLHHELKTKFYEMKRQSTIIGAKKAAFIPIGFGGLYMFGQGATRIYDRLLNSGLRAAESSQKKQQ